MNLIELFRDPTFQTVLMGTMSIGAVTGAIGCFAYLRRQSLVGDVVSHSSLLGIMLFFLVSYVKLEPAIVGGLLFGSKILDVVTDPPMGFV